MGLYNAEISAGSLMLPESRRIAKLLLGRPTQEQWDAALKHENLLQKRPATARRFDIPRPHSAGCHFRVLDS